MNAFSTHKIFAEMLLYCCQANVESGSGGSSIGRTRRTPPLIGEKIAFSSIFWNKVKLTILFQPKCGLRPFLLHILDPPLVRC